jgi:hypothetical protein
MRAKDQLIVWAILVGLAHLPARAEAPNNVVADRIANFVQGRLIAQGGAIYYAAKVNGRVNNRGELTLETEVDPLYAIELIQGPYGADGGVSYYDVSIPTNAKCGALGLPTKLASTDISVRKGNQFINLRDALPVSDLPSFSSSYRPFNISEKDLAMVRACARSVSAKVAAMPFGGIQVYAGESLLTEVIRTTERSTSYERDLGDDNPITHISITPKAGMTEPYSVEVQAVSVMHCDYEGPHIELDNWKQGFSTAKAFRQKGNIFYVDASTLDSTLPTFPPYTQKELRQAIRKHFGEVGMSSIKEAEPCAPFLRGHRFRIKYGSDAVQDISVYTPGGC